ncbi:MAG: hypothetical protein JNL48_13790 [Acidobacteria bacterium]|nr:hypothetical protein [Acidobacteriota bacterium]
MSRLLRALLVLTILATPRLSAAQGFLGGIIDPGVATNGAPNQVLSFNPIGMVMEFYNAEYEVRVGDALTAGAGASRRGWYLFGEGDSPRLNGDAFVRYYPSGSAFNGIALGLKVGGTRLPNERTLPGIGFDINHSYAMTDHLVLSSGLGMKRLIGRRQGDYGQDVITTLRMNVGIGF